MPLLHLPARLILPAVVGEDEQRLAQANRLVEGATNVTNLLGPALAGVLIAAARRGERDVARRGVIPRRRSSLIGLFVRVVREAHDRDEGGGMWAGLPYLARTASSARSSLAVPVRRPVPAGLRFVPGARVSRVPPRSARRRHPVRSAAVAASSARSQPMRSPAVQGERIALAACIATPRRYGCSCRTSRSRCWSRRSP